ARVGRVDPERRARRAGYEVRRPQLDRLCPEIERRVYGLVAVVDEALSRRVGSAGAGRIVCINECEGTRLHGHENRAGMAMPAGRPARLNGDLLRDEVHWTVRLELDALRTVDVELVGIRSARVH